MDPPTSSGAPVSDPGTVLVPKENVSSDAMSRQEAMVRFANIDSSMEKIFGLLSSFAQDKQQQAASQSSAATPPPGSAVSTAGGETPSSSGTGMLHTITSSVGQAGQVHPATAPSFVKLASQSLPVTLPAHSIASPAPLGVMSSNGDPGTLAGQGTKEAPSVVSPTLALSISSALPPVPGYLVEKIKKGQYVDFNLLRPCNLKKAASVRA